MFPKRIHRNMVLVHLHCRWENVQHIDFVSMLTSPSNLVAMAKIQKITKVRLIILININTKQKEIYTPLIMKLISILWLSSLVLTSFIISSYHIHTFDVFNVSYSHWLFYDKIKHWWRQCCRKHVFFLIFYGLICFFFSFYFAARTLKNCFQPRGFVLLKEINCFILFRFYKPQEITPGASITVRLVDYKQQGKTEKDLLHEREGITGDGPVKDDTQICAKDDGNHQRPKVKQKRFFARKSTGKLGERSSKHRKPGRRLELRSNSKKVFLSFYFNMSIIISTSANGKCLYF